LISTAVFDLETSALEGDRGIILCACIESSREPGKIITIRSDETNPDWDSGKRGNDKETVKQVVAILKDHDVLVAHNGNRFDVPFLRTRLLRWDLARLPDIKLVDPCYIAFRKFRLRNNSLGVVADHVGVKDRKTPLDMSVWGDAILNGSRRAMNKIVEHCIADIKVLGGVLTAVKPYIKLLDDRGSGM
jgi:uncharacterized protein YprB with RNaseH-like and TPR domain